MKRIFILILSGAPIIGFAQTSGCKDTIFNLKMTQHLCKADVLGEWNVDSISGGLGKSIDTLSKPAQKRTYTFYPSGDLYINWTNDRGEKLRETSSYALYKGNMILKNINSNGIVVLTPQKYEIRSISRERFEILMIYNNEYWSRVILKKLN